MKLNKFKSILDRFYSGNKIKIYFLFILSIIAGLIEYMGLILIFQFVLFLSNPNAIHCKKIILFFEKNFNIFDFSLISLVLGISIAMIYILKNIYMLFFVKYNNKILQNLSTCMTLKIIKNILFQDFIKVIQTTKEEKLNIIFKIPTVVWQYCNKCTTLFMNCVVILIIVSYLFIKFTFIAVVAAILIVILAGFEYLYLRKNSKYQDKYFPKCSNELNLLFYRISGCVKEIKLANKQNDFVSKVQKKYSEYADLQNQRVFCDVFHVHFTEISIMFGLVVILCALFYTKNFDNQLLITTLCTICAIILRLTPLINRIQGCLYSINSTESIVDEVLNFDDSLRENLNCNFTYEKLPFDSEIELKNVEFSYKDNLDGLKDINLKIKAGEFIGIVGKSGCYKTTLSLILSGLIKPIKGTVSIDGVNLDEMEILKWQNNIALLSQDYSFLFDSIDEIDKKYLKELALDNEQDINNLSYGQKQRLALANILALDKKVLILDEITSSSDVVNENKINNILLNLKGKKTIIAIAHRFQILKHCDKVIYMDDGRIIDIDTFKNLSEKYFEFEKMVKLSNFEV